MAFSLRAHWKKRFDRWMAERISPCRKVTLDRRIIYILPTSSAFMFITACGLVFIAAINYAVSLAFGLAGLVIVVVGFTVIRIEPRSKYSPVVKAYQGVGRELEKIDLGRRQGEGPLDYRDRVIDARPELKELMTQLTELYISLS